MSRWLKAYFSIEAEMVFPIILVLYYLIILLAVTLFSGCIKSQNTFVEDLKKVRFTNVSEEYGEVIYGQMEGSGEITESFVIRINPINRIIKEWENED